MTCSGRYSEAWAYAAFWCAGGFAKGTHQGAGPADAALLDVRVNFLNMGVEAGVGMVLYNLTAGTSGPVTAVTDNTVTATGVTWAANAIYRIVAISAAEIATIEMYLDITAADIHAARAATGGCSCTLQSWAMDFFTKINIIEAGAFHTCSCGAPRISDEAKSNILTWASTQLDAIRNGTIAFCEGDAGKEYPAVGWSEIAHTAWGEIEIMDNYDKRTP
jgi:hypothetical protein